VIGQDMPPFGAKAVMQMRYWFTRLVLIVGAKSC